MVAIEGQGINWGVVKDPKDTKLKLDYNPGKQEAIRDGSQATSEAVYSNDIAPGHFEKDPATNKYTIVGGAGSEVNQYSGGVSILGMFGAWMHNLIFGNSEPQAVAKDPGTKSKDLAPASTVDTMDDKHASVMVPVTQSTIDVEAS